MRNISHSEMLRPRLTFPCGTLIDMR